jgi:hypothetical protein
VCHPTAFLTGQWLAQPAQEPAEQLEQEAPELTFFSVPLVPNLDGLRLTLSEPQLVQGTFDLRVKRSFSKLDPHDSH